MSLVSSSAVAAVVPFSPGIARPGRTPMMLRLAELKAILPRVLLVSCDVALADR